MSTGLVVTCSVTHATPAVFVAHTDSRTNQLTIARQIAEGDIDVILGGGLGYFLLHSNPNSYRYDELDLLSFFNKQELNQKGPGQKNQVKKQQWCLIYSSLIILARLSIWSDCLPENICLKSVRIVSLP